MTEPKTATCPVCKGGVAPHVERCPCVDTAAKGATHG
jgi:hypothetical protein